MKTAITQQLTANLRAVIDDADELLKATADDASAALGGVRTRLEESVRTARAQMNKFEDAVVAQSRAAAGATNEYVHSNPWPSIGIAASVGVLLGVLLGRR